MVVGFVGLGAMGAAIAPRLLGAGDQLVVHDVRTEAVDAMATRGARAAASPREVADRAEVVFTSLPSPEVSRDVVTGPDGVRGGHAMRVLVELSTIGEPTARACAGHLASTPAGYLDAPVSGGVRGATDGTLTVMVSGAADLIADTMPLLRQVGSTVVVVGERPGQAQVVKLANNLLSASAILVSAEAVLLAVKAGIDPRVVIDVVSTSTGRNSAITDKFAQFVLSRTFASRYRLDLIAKDVRLCLEASGELRTPMFVGRQIEQLFTLAETTLGHDRDSLDIIRLLEDWAGTVIDDQAWRTAREGSA